MRPNCPRCTKERPVKNGHALGRRRWKCRLCQYEFTKKALHGKPDGLKREAIVLYEVGWSSQAVGKRMRVSPTSVLVWARQCTWPHGRVYHLKPRIYLPPEVKAFETSLKMLMADL